MLDKNQNIKANNNGFAAGRDINIISLNNRIKENESAIEKILKCITDVNIDISFEKLDITPFDVCEKIDYNDIKCYKDFLDDYMESLEIIKRKVDIIMQTDLGFENKLFGYIKNKFRYSYSSEIKPDDIIREIIDNIKSDLKYNIQINLDDFAYIDCIIFYVFAKCKIFKKPPVEGH